MQITKPTIGLASIFNKYGGQTYGGLCYLHLANLLSVRTSTIKVEIPYQIGTVTTFILCFFLIFGGRSVNYVFFSRKKLVNYLFFPRKISRLWGTESTPTQAKISRLLVD